MKTKICSKCGEEKSVESYAKRYDPRRPPDARYPACKQCVYLRRKANGIENRRAKAKGRRQGLKRRGFSVELYDQLSSIQENRCGICEQTVEGNLDIDHDHLTGKIRALLCRRCNLGLGYFLDNVDLLAKAQQYLEHHNNN